MTLTSLILYLGGFLIGASVGSFLGCAIYRLPRGLSLVRGRSACPGCGHQLTPVELIPVLSYLRQRSRARCCGIKLSPAYLWAELSCGLVGLAIMYFIIKKFIAI